jgi:hypothetical protein
MDKQLKIGIETIDLLEQMTRVNNQLWIVPNRMQTVISPDSSKILVVQLKDDIPDDWFPSWKGNDIGFGINDGIGFVRIIKKLQKPYWDFSKLQSKKQLLIIDEQTKSNLTVQTIAPDSIARMDISKFRIPNFEVQINLPWGEVENLNKLTKLLPKVASTKKKSNLEIRSDGKECWFKINDGGVEKYFIEDWSPNNKFLYFIKPDRCKVAKGDYTIHLSEQAMSKWISSDGKYIYYIPLEPNGWFEKKKTQSEILQKRKVSPVKVLTSKEHQTATDFAGKVNASWRKSVDAIIETGELLDEAKTKFRRNEMMWSSFMNSLPFGIRTVEMLINIAKHKSLLLNPKIHNQLPASWGTLHELVSVGSSQPITIYENDRGEVSLNPKEGFSKKKIGKEDMLLRGIEDKEPLIKPDMTRKDAINYRTRVENTYFPVVVKKSAKPQPETFLTIKVRTGKDVSVETLREVRDEVKSVLKGKPFAIVENKRVIKKRK